MPNSILVNLMFFFHSDLWRGERGFEKLARVFSEKSIKNFSIPLNFQHKNLKIALLNFSMDIICQGTPKNEQVFRHKKKFLLVIFCLPFIDHVRMQKERLENFSNISKNSFHFEKADENFFHNFFTTHGCPDRRDESIEWRTF